MKRILSFIVFVMLVAATIQILGTRSQEVQALPSQEIERWHLDASGNEIGFYHNGCAGGLTKTGNTSLGTPMVLYYAEDCGTSSICTACYSNGAQTACDSSFDALCTFYIGAPCSQFSGC